MFWCFSLLFWPDVFFLYDFFYEVWASDLLAYSVNCFYFLPTKGCCWEAFWMPFDLPVLIANWANCWVQSINIGERAVSWSFIMIGDPEILTSSYIGEWMPWLLYAALFAGVSSVNVTAYWDWALLYPKGATGMNSGALTLIISLSCFASCLLAPFQN